MENLKQYIIVCCYRQDGREHEINLDIDDLTEANNYALQFIENHLLDRNFLVEIYDQKFDKIILTIKGNADYGI